MARERAALGDRYLTELHCEVLRLSLLCGDGLHDTLKGMVPAMGAAELEGFRTNYARRAAERFPPVTQLPGRNEVKAFSGDEYKV